MLCNPMPIVALQVHQLAWLGPYLSSPQSLGHTASVQSSDHPCDSLAGEYDHRPAHPPQIITLTSRIWISDSHLWEYADTQGTALRMKERIIQSAWTFELHTSSRRSVLRLPPSVSFVYRAIPLRYRHIDRQAQCEAINARKEPR